MGKLKRFVFKKVAKTTFQLEKLLKSELKVRAIRLGIKNGYHGRVISKMRKKDFIDFINESDCIELLVMMTYHLLIS